MASYIWVNIGVGNGCCLFAAKPLTEPMLTYCQLDALEQTSVKFESKHKYFSWKNAFENAVCKMASILFRAQHVKQQDPFASLDTAYGQVTWAT